MSSRTIASFAVAIMLGVIAVLLVRGYLASQTTRPQAVAGMTPVVVAVGPIARGALLKPAMLKVVNFTTESAPEGSFQSIDQLVPAGQPAKVVLRDVAANEPVVVGKLSGPGAKANLAGALTPGMRAVGLRSSDVAGVGGFVLPGDRVDVLLTRTIGSGDATSSIVQVLAENALVLGVDQSSDADKPTVAKAVTVEVSPDQAQAISLAQAVGNVTLTLRQSADSAPLARRVTTLADLGGARPSAPVVRRAAAPRPAQPPVPQVRVTRGVEISAYPVAS